MLYTSSWVESHFFPLSVVAVVREIQFPHKFYNYNSEEDERERDEKCINNPSVVFGDTFENGGSFDSYFLVNNNESL